MAFMDDQNSKRDRNQSRQRLIEAGVSAFARLGPRATVDEICADAELNKRMVYHYFGSKAGLYEAGVGSCL